MEIIDKLLPLLQQGGEGAFWLALFWLAKGYISIIAVAGTVVYALKVLCGALISTARSSNLCKQLYKDATGQAHFSDFTVEEIGKIERYIERLRGRQ